MDSENIVIAGKKKKQNFSISTVDVTSRLGHKEAIVSIAGLKPYSNTSQNDIENESSKLNGELLKDPNIFFTNSEDKMIKMWDLRVNNCKAVRCFQHKTLLNEEMGNCIATYKYNKIYTANQNRIVAFDFAMEKLFCNTETHKFENNTIDSKEEAEINHIAFSPDEEKIYYCDDSGSVGNVKADDLTPHSQNSIIHTNIPFSVAPCEVKLDGKKYKRQELVYSGGFDSTLLCSNLYDNKVLTKTATNELLARCLQTQHPTPAMIYNIHYNELFGDLQLSLQTGHVISVKAKKPTDIRFFIEGHFNRVKKAEYATFDTVRYLYNSRLKL